MQSARDVALRLLSCFAVARAAYEQPPTSVRLWLESSGLTDHLSPAELLFISLDSPTEEQKGVASWRTEACPMLSWALSIDDAMVPPSVRTDLDYVGVTDQILLDPVGFVQGAQLRPKSELEAMHAHLYDLHWAVRAGPTARKLFGHDDYDEATDPSIVYERHYAINWIVDGGDWDSVLTDT